MKLTETTILAVDQTAVYHSYSIRIDAKFKFYYIQQRRTAEHFPFNDRYDDVIVNKQVTLKEALEISKDYPDTDNLVFVEKLSKFIQEGGLL